jgi:DNA-binding IclR family transcriptional regulator
MQGDDFSASHAEDKDRNFVTALARGLDVLRCFHRNDVELTNTDFAERTGLPKATVSRLTHTLVKLEYLVADPRKGTYRLGAGVLQLGFGVLSGMDIGARADDELRALRDGPNSYVTVAIGEQHRMDAVYVAIQRSREDVALTMRIGSRLPLFFSAIGRAILVGLSESERKDAVLKADLLDPAGKAQRDESLGKALQDYKAYGFCTGYGHWRPDVNGIAVPVYSLNGARVYGLNVGGPSFHVKRKQLEKVYAPLLIAAAQRLSIGS